MQLQTLIRTRVPELLKFGTVGGVAFLVHNIVFLIANGPLNTGPTIAKAAAVAIATVVSYFGNRNWSFAKRKTSNVQREGLFFVMVNVIGFGVEWLPLGVSHYLLGFHSGFADWFSGVIIGTGLGMIFRYFAYRNWVFNAG